MWPQCYWYEEKKPSLSELESRVKKISETISCIRESELSSELISASVNELQKKKDKLIEQMLEIIEEMRN